MSACLPNLRFDQENIFADIYTVNDGLFARVFADDILLEVCKCTLVRRSRQANNKRVEVLQHLLPYVIDGAVTFINDDTVEVFRGIFFIVQDNLGSFGICSSQFGKGRFFGRVIQLFTAEDGIHTLNGADTDLRTGRNIGTLQSGDAIQLCKRTRIIIWMIG